VRSVRAVVNHIAHRSVLSLTMFSFVVKADLLCDASQETECDSVTFDKRLINMQQSVEFVLCMLLALFNNVLSCVARHCRLVAFSDKYDER